MSALAATEVKSSTAPRQLAGACLFLFLSACSNESAPMSAPTTVTVPSAGAPAAGGSAGSAVEAAAGRASPSPPPPPDAGAPTDPPPIGPPAPTDASMPVDAGMSNVDDEDAGAAEPHPPTCADDTWKLAQGFRVARRVDYIADRTIMFAAPDSVQPPVFITLSSAGTPCATATDRAHCMSSLDQNVPAGRHLVTTEGDNVRIWQGDPVRSLLGLVDTAAEAIWYATTTSVYAVPCTATVEAVDTGFVIHGARPGVGCSLADAGMWDLDLLVTSADGFVRETQSVSSLVCGNTELPPPPNTPTP